MQFDAPFISDPMPVEPQWIDYNDHLNMAYYNVLMDRGVDQLWDLLGFGIDYRTRTGCTTFSAEYHMRYMRELNLGDQVRVSFQLIDHTEKSFHFYQELRHIDGWLSARGEGLGLHVDQSGDNPRVAPMPPAILSGFQALKAAHAPMPRPETTGKAIAIRR
ncbi:thioesterase family protein [Alisedimentitalea sp. MJ-SS2]|uniref:thioesterase family protein n=1 Tax=Aliisedimentitalea sp. MJ-SS2 TaxID=3049795 RepID=UPI0029143951|nr:thioesterase family protein [Alisedimentitalea sp. MJ-SS2]MDU8928916.1 thioesterase family protein [Alisedimentitalea sp. MJ-SS2]